MILGGQQCADVAQQHEVGLHLSSGRRRRRGVVERRPFGDGRRRTQATLDLLLTRASGWAEWDASGVGGATGGFVTLAAGAA